MLILMLHDHKIQLLAWAMMAISVQLNISNTLPNYVNLLLQPCAKNALETLLAPKTTPENLAAKCKWSRFWLQLQQLWQFMYR